MCETARWTRLIRQDLKVSTVIQDVPTLRKGADGTHGWDVVQGGSKTTSTTILATTVVAAPNPSTQATNGSIPTEPTSKAPSDAKGSTEGGSWISNTAERFKNVVLRGMFKTDAQVDEWGRGIAEAQKLGPAAVAAFLRDGNLPTWPKDAAAMVVTGGAASEQRAVAQAMKEAFARQAADSLANSTEKMVIENSAHIFAKGRFGSIGTNDEVASGISGAMRSSSGRLSEGDNTIMTLINNRATTIRARIQDGALSNINAFPGVSSRTIGNVIDLR